MSGGVLFHDCRLVDPERGEERRGWLKVEGAALAALGEGEPPAAPGAEPIDARGRALAPALIDLSALVDEPGGARGDRLEDALAAAAAGGVGTILLQPWPGLPLDDPNAVEGLRRKAEARGGPRVLIAAALTAGLAGARIAELGLLKDAGAVAASTGPSPIAEARLARRAFAYAKAMDVLAIVRPEEASIAAGAAAHEGDLAARLGLAPSSPLAERLQIDRDAALAGSLAMRVHFDRLSSAQGLAALARARAEGAAVSASVSAAHLMFNEIDLGGLDPAFRLAPPLRAEADRTALVKAVIAGEIEAVVSAHEAIPVALKRAPFPEAAPGAPGLETLLAALMSLREAGATLAQALRPATIGPARLLGLAQGRLAAGAPADLVLFDPDAPWVCRAGGLRTSGRFTPFEGRRLQGKPLLTMVGGRVVFAAEEGR